MFLGNEEESDTETEDTPELKQAAIESIISMLIDDEDMGKNDDGTPQLTEIRDNIPESEVDETNASKIGNKSNDINIEAIEENSLTNLSLNEYSDSDSEITMPKEIIGLDDATKGIFFVAFLLFLSIDLNFVNIY